MSDSTYQPKTYRKQGGDTFVVASGGAGTMEHFREAAEAGATVLLAASVFHFGVISIPELKCYLRSCGLNLNSPT